MQVDDAREVVQLLDADRGDLLERCGGSCESRALQGRTADGRMNDGETRAREAYFLDFARDLAASAAARWPSRCWAAA